LNFSQQFLIFVCGDKSDGKTTGTKTSCTTNTMKITIWAIGHIIIYYNVDAFDIDSSTEDISCDTDTLVEVFEGLVSSNTVVRGESMGSLPFFLWKTSVDGDTREVTFAQQSIQFGSSANTLDKDDNLVEFQSVEKII
jgi:hypothetical protein